MASDPLFDRLRDALLPDYRLEREIGSGGMGMVYLATDLTLDSPVAVKLLRPELDTAYGAEAFMREAQLMARVRHPNVVSIYHAHAKNGLHFYIMEFVDGPTLQKRLEHGPLSRDDAVRMGRDLLDGLESVHRAGIVHRDIKPSNVFVIGDRLRAKLSDFGIARPPTLPQRAGNERRSVIQEGTPGYQAPEQLSGGPITPATDLYQAGLVIYEALTNERYLDVPAPSWRGIPGSIASVLRRALREQPDKWWADAREFRHALWRTRVIPYLLRAAALTAGGLIVGSAIMWAIDRFWHFDPAPALTVAVPSFDYAGARAGRALADSLVATARDELQGHADFRVVSARPWLPRWTRTLTINGQAEVRNDTLHVQLSSAPNEWVSAPLTRWRSLSDSVAYRILLAVWDAQSSLAPSLPQGALPRTPTGLAEFFDAEQLVAAGKWSRAFEAYTHAQTTDSSCWLCAWRLTEVERWLGRDRDPVSVHRYLSHIDSFPEWYQSLMRAAQVPLEARLDTLHRVTQRWPEFFLGWFQWGDELFHRGPLAGYARAEAIDALERVVKLRPDFAPAWEHLVWVYSAEGDSLNAVRALDSLNRRDVSDDPYALALRKLLGLGIAWRFFPEHARAMTRTALADPLIRANPDLGAGPRLLGMFDAPRGQVGFGELLAAFPEHDLKRSGLIAQAMGSLALGQPTKARALVQQIRALSPESEMSIFDVEFDAVMSLLDPAASIAPQRAARTWPAEDHERAAVATRLIDPGDRQSLIAFMNTRDIDSTARNVDPFFRAVARMLRAEAAAQRGDVQSAERELVWHEHSDLVRLPTGPPQAADVDWAFGTLARWRLAALLATSGDGRKACDAYRDIVRLWSDGEPLYRARADTARQRMTELHCGS